MKVLITGATGLIGKEVGKVLAEKGHQIFVVSRNRQKAQETLPFPCEVIEGDLSQGPLVDTRIKNIDAVINLMGESIVGERWTESKKQRIYESRITGTRNLVASLSSSLKTFIAGSAIGIYGNCHDQEVDESFPAGEDYLAKICVEWESEAAKAPGRKVYLRTGVVLAQSGGALDKMLFPFRAGVGGAIGDGQNWMSWIHIKDIVGLIVFALENEKVEGPLNGVAPIAVKNREFSAELAQAVGRTLGPRVPEVVLKVLFGEASQAILSSVRCVASKAMALGYRFHFSDIQSALNDICSYFKNGEEIFYAEQFVPVPPEKVFPFFQEAKNLERITPPLLSFHIDKVSTGEIKQGTLIDYKLKIHGVPARWKTEIDEWMPPYKFVDNQLKGPYRLWHHTHEFRPFCGGTLMVDKVRYRMPMGFLGWLAASHFVRQDVEQIFAYRRNFVATHLDEITKAPSF